MAAPQQGRYAIIVLVLGLTGCATHGPFVVGTPYGVRVSYAEGRHPGLDFDIRPGTPIIAAADGIVTYLADPCPGQRHCGGLFVVIRHGDAHRSVYGHLSEVAVQVGEQVKRGALLGVSGVSNNGYSHLHFGICKIAGDCINHSATYDPGKLWLGDEPRCFNPDAEYSAHSHTALTLPVACPEYAARLAGTPKR